MKKVLFKKWIPQQMVTVEGKMHSTRKEGTGCWEVDFTHEGLFHEWGVSHIEGDNGFGNYSIALIQIPDGTIQEVLPSNLKFID